MSKKFHGIQNYSFWKFHFLIFTPTMEDSTKKKFSLKDALKLLFVLGVIIALSFLFPAKKNSVNVQKQGEIWKSADLYAPFDIPVRKSDAQIKKEKAKLSNSIPAVYSKSNASEGVMLESLVSELSSTIPEISSYSDFIAGKLSEEFRKGIVSKKQARFMMLRASVLYSKMNL